MTVQSQQAFQCTKCGFINFVLTHCPRCDCYIMSQVLVLEPLGFEESQKHNALLKQKDLFPLNP